MATKKTTKKEPVKRRKRRSADEQIQDLQQKIEDLKRRKAARELKEDPCAKQAIVLTRSLNKAVSMAEEHKDTAFQRAAAEAHASLAGYLDAKGLKVPKARKPRGRKPKN